MSEDKMLDSRGLLPQDKTISLAEFEESFFVKGDKSYPSWNMQHRKKLARNFVSLAKILIDFGVNKVLVDGSFVTSKFEPNDIDACYSIDMNEFIRLVTLYPIFDMSRKVGKKPAMWAQHNIELFPDFGQPAMVDSQGNGIPFPSFFRMTRDGQQKGLLIIELGDHHD
jgi:hypothetical protein